MPDRRRIFTIFVAICLGALLYIFDEIFIHYYSIIFGSNDYLNYVILPFIAASIYILALLALRFMDSVYFTQWIEMELWRALLILAAVAGIFAILVGVVVPAITT